MSRRSRRVRVPVPERVGLICLWVDGIHLKVRLEADKVCLLVMIVVGADGPKELIALADGFREYSDVD